MKYKIFKLARLSLRWELAAMLLGGLAFAGGIFFIDRPWEASFWEDIFLNGSIIVTIAGFLSFVIATAVFIPGLLRLSHYKTRQLLGDKGTKHQSKWFLVASFKAIGILMASLLEIWGYLMSLSNDSTEEAPFTATFEIYSAMYNDNDFNSYLLAKNSGYYPYHGSL